MKRDEKKALNKQKMIDAAYDLMLKQGIHATTIKEVSEKSGISFVTMYKYFPSKKELVEEVVIKFMNIQTAKMLQIAMEKQSNFLEKTGEFAKLMQSIKDTYDPAIIHEFFVVIHDTPRIREHAESWDKKFWKTMIEGGRQSGFIKTTASDDAIYFLIHMLSTYIQEHDHKIDKKIMSQIGRLVTYGVRGEEQ